MRALERYRGKEPDTEPIQPSETHLRTVTFLDEMMMLIAGDRKNPIIRLLHTSRPAILRDLMTIPEDRLRSLLGELGKRIMVAAYGDNTVVLQAKADTSEDI